MTSKQKYMTKTVSFGGSKLTLYSLDGNTWSSRRDELQNILHRHESEKVTAAQLRGEVPEGAPAGQQSPALRKPTAFGGRFMPPRPQGQVSGPAGDQNPEKKSDEQVARPTAVSKPNTKAHKPSAKEADTKRKGDSSSSKKQKAKSTSSPKKKAAA